MVSLSGRDQNLVAVTNSIHLNAQTTYDLIAFTSTPTLRAWPPGFSPTAVVVWIAGRDQDVNDLDRIVELGAFEQLSIRIPALVKPDALSLRLDDLRMRHPEADEKNEPVSANDGDLARRPPPFRLEPHEIGTAGDRLTVGVH